MIATDLVMLSAAIWLLDMFALSLQGVVLSMHCYAHNSGVL